MDMGIAKVYIIGAGPGDPELLTLKGFELLSQADLVVYAGSLVNPDILSFCKDGAQLVNSHGKKLDELVQLMAWEALSGKKVVRLASGDPSLYGSLKEMREELGKLGVDVEVIPGVSSLFAGAAALKEEFTVPEGPQSLVVTRLPGKTPVRPQEALERFAATGASIAIFLSVDKLEEIKRRCLRAGLSPDTPVAVVYKASWQDQRIYETTLGELSPIEGVEGSAIVYILPGRNLEGRRSHLYGGEAKSKAVHYDDEFNIVSAGGYGIRVVRRILEHFHASSVIAGCALRECFLKAWSSGKPVVFVGPVGVAVRLAAPLIRDKSVDPPLVCVDIAGSFVVSVLGGHRGANALARRIASVLGSVPVITTGTEALGVASLEEVLIERGLELIGGDAKRFNSASIRGASVYIVGMGWRKDPTQECFKRVLDEVTSLVDAGRVAVVACPLFKAGEAKKLLLPLLPKGVALVGVPEDVINAHPGVSPSRAQDKLGLVGVAEPCALSVVEGSHLVVEKRVVDCATSAVAEVSLG